jgi:hypothetical protein
MNIMHYLFIGTIGIAVLAIISIPILDYFNRRAIEKSRSRNVEFYAFNEEIYKKSNELWECQAEMDSQKTEIDNLVVRTKYAPQFLKEHLEKEIEVKKELLYQFEKCVFEPMKKELQEMRDRENAWRAELEKQGEKIY